LFGKRVLEPSCGCGRFLDALRQRGARCVGYEVDATRANLCRAKGHSVAVLNFLETHPSGDFDLVVMNPPFYGPHYLKHIEHALGFLKPDGLLVSILPITARHDHGVICAEWAEKHSARMATWEAWDDLPLGSFAESGTNINTTVLKLRKV
jgi:SAM-dependent methyltransferase